MNSTLHRPMGAAFFPLAVLIGMLLSGAARAAEQRAAAGPLMGEGHWRLAVSPFSHHFRPKPEHRRVWALGTEWQRSDDWLAGGSYFSNSFGQPSAYLYVGKRWTGLFGEPKLFAQASGGLLYGYRGQYEDKVPLNHNGFSPGAVVSMGWQLNKNFAVTGHLLGDAAVMLQLSYDLR